MYQSTYMQLPGTPREEFVCISQPQRGEVHHTEVYMLESTDTHFQHGRVSYTCVPLLPVRWRQTLLIAPCEIFLFGTNYQIYDQ